MQSNRIVSVKGLAKLNNVEINSIENVNARDHKIQRDCLAEKQIWMEIQGEPLR